MESLNICQSPLSSQRKGIRNLKLRISSIECKQRKKHCRLFSNTGLKGEKKKLGKPFYFHWDFRVSSKWLILSHNLKVDSLIFFIKKACFSVL